MRSVPVPALLGALALLLIVMALLNAAALLHVGGPGGTKLGATSFSAVLALFYVTAVLAALLPKSRFVILMAAALLQLFFIHGPWRAAGALLVWTLFYHLVHLRVSWWVKAPAIAALYVAPFLLLRPGAASGLMGVLMVTHFASDFVYRSALYAYEATAKKEQLRGAGYREFLLYLIASPMGAVQAPPIGFVSLHQNSLTRTDPELMKRGIGQMSLGVLYLAVNHAGRSGGWLPLQEKVVETAAGLNTLTVLAASHLVLLGLFLDVIGHVHIAIGMLRVLGFALPSGSDRPYLARNILMFWRRWNTNYRDYLMTLAYYPVAGRLRRRPYLAVVAGGACTFLLSGFSHAVAEFVGNPGSLTLRRFIEPHILFIVYGSLVVAWMLREAKGRRKPKPGAAGRAAEASLPARLLGLASIPAAVTVVSLTYTIFRRPFNGGASSVVSALLRWPQW